MKQASSHNRGMLAEFSFAELWALTSLYLEILSLARKNQLEHDL